MNATRHPYPGLRAFRRDESDLFFGREGCVDEMVDRLGGERFLAVLGPSGGGKSSLVRTGLFDALDLGFLQAAGSDWLIIDMHPAGQPMYQLAVALLTAVSSAKPSEDAVDAMTRRLREGPRSIAIWASEGNVPSGTSILLLVDQFEELFRYASYSQREEADAFVALLLESAAAKLHPIYVVITMRSEYLGACSSINHLAEHISTGLYLTPHMERDACREAIEGPAGVMGFQLEPALVNRMLNDLATFTPRPEENANDLATQLAMQADQLPLMQHVLNRLWLLAESTPHEGPAVLTLDAYKALGGMSGAIDAHGSEVISRLSEDAQHVLEPVFRALVVGNSVSSASRQPSKIHELTILAGGDRAAVIEVVEAFCSQDCNFLRTSNNTLDDDTIVDISHESLIRQWTPLREWLDKEARDGAAWRRLVSAQERYAAGEEELLTGLGYQRTAAWWAAVQPTPAWAARHGGNFDAVKAFVEASHKEEEARVRLETRRQHEARNRRLVAAGIAVGVLALVGSFSYVNHEEAQNAKLDTARRLEAASYATNMKQAQQEFDAGDYGSGTELMKKWMNLNVEPAVRVGFEWNWLWARYNGDSATTYHGNWDEVRSVAAAPTGFLIATASADSTVRVFDRRQRCSLGTGAALKTGVPVDEKNALQCLQLKYIFLVVPDKLTGYDKLARLDKTDSSSDGIKRQIVDLLKQNGWKGKLIHPPGGGVPYPALGSVRGASSVRFSPDGAWLGVVTGNSRSRNVPSYIDLVNMANGEPSSPIRPERPGVISALAFGKDGEMATAGTVDNDKIAQFFKINPDGSALQEVDKTYDPLNKVRDTMNAIVYSPNGQYVAMAFLDGNLAVKDLATTGFPEDPQMIDVSGLTSAVFYDDDTILVGCKDGHIWQVSLKHRPPRIVVDTGQGLIGDMRLSTHEDPATHKKTTLLITSGATVGVWLLKQHNGDLEAWNPVFLSGHRDNVNQADISADQTLVVSAGAGEDHEVRFWTKQTPHTYGYQGQPEDMRDHPPDYTSSAVTIGVEGVVRALAFSPLQGARLVFLRGQTKEGTTVGHAANATDIFLYDLTNPGDPIKRTVLHGYGTAVAYSPDGKYVVVGGEQGSVTLWDTNHLGTNDSVEIEHTTADCENSCPIAGLVFSPDGKSLIATKGSKILHWNLNSGAATLRDVYQPAPSLDRKGSGSIAFSPNGQWLAICNSASSPNAIEVWNVDRIFGGKWKPDDQPERKLNELDSACSSIAFSPNSRWLAAGTASRNLLVWDTSNENPKKWIKLMGDSYKIKQNGNLVDSPPAPAPSPATSYIKSVTFSPDSKIVAYGSTDSNIFLWNLEIKQPLPTISLHAGGVWSIAFSPNGNCLAAGSTDGALRIFPTAEPRLEQQDWMPYGSSWSSCVGSPQHR